MRFRRRHRDIPELNTTSTADISFMLLVFFLVTSSMDSDKGLGRKLAPIDEQQQEQVDVNRSDVLQIRIDEHDALFCDDKPATLAQLQQQVESCVASRQTDPYIIAECGGGRLSDLAREDGPSKVRAFVQPVYGGRTGNHPPTLSSANQRRNGK